MRPFNFARWLKSLSKPARRIQLRKWPADRPRLQVQLLEDRLAPATLTESGTILTVTLNNTNEFLGITSAGTSYTLSSTNPIVDGGITAGRATFGGTNGTVTADGLAAYDTIRIVDGAGVQGTRVTFNDSGANAYGDHIVVELNQDTAALDGEQSIVVNGASKFGAFNLNVSTTRNIAVNGNIATSNGAIVLVANPAGTSTGPFTGISIMGAQLTASGTGAIHLTGKGGTSSTSNVFNRGVDIFNSQVIGGSSGDAVVIDGFGGTTLFNPFSQRNTGINVQSFVLVSSNGGNVRLTGQGDGPADSDGVTISGEISAGGSGSVTVIGNFSPTRSRSSNNRGIALDGSGKITSSGGAVVVIGQGGPNSGFGSSGIAMSSGTRIMAGGSGSVTVTGSGGSGGSINVNNVNYGIRMLGSNPGISSAVITSSGGNVLVTGNGGGGSGTGNFNAGVGMLGFATISAGSSGTVTVTGAGGSTIGTQNHGVYLVDSTASITSSGGDVQVTGTPGNGTLQFAISAVGVISTPLQGGNITLIGDSMNLVDGNVNAGSRTVALRPKTTNGTVGINLGGPDAAGTLGLSGPELNRITAGSLHVGHSSSGTLTVSAAISRAGPTSIALTTGGNIVFNPGSISTAGGALTLSPGSSGSVQPITSGTDINITSATLGFGSGSDLSIVISGTTVDTQYRQLNVAGTVNLAGVDLVLAGSHGPSLGQSFVIVNNDGADPIVGKFNGLTEGARITHFLGSGFDANISYTGGSGNDVVLTVVAPESDGVADEIENVAPNHGDGNSDGISDSQQSNVASLPNSSTASYVTLESPTGTSLADVEAVANPSPADAPEGVIFPIGFLDFSIQGVAVGAASTMTLYLPTGVTANTYYKFGRTPDNTTPHWYQFLYDGTTGAQFNPAANTITLHFVDGGRGDDDLEEDGVIVDPGSAGLKFNQPPVRAG